MTTSAIKRCDRAGHVIKAAAAAPPNLLVLFASVTTAVLSLLSGPLLAISVLGLGALSYATLIWLDTRNTAFIARVLALPADSDASVLVVPLKPDVLPATIEPCELRDCYRSIIAQHGALRRALLASEGPLRSILMESFTRCGLLVQQAGHIARRGNALHRYLLSQEQSEIERRTAALEDSAQRTRDPEASRIFIAAAYTRLQHLESFQEIEGLYDRIRAKLAVIEATFDELQARVVKLSGVADECDVELIGASITESVNNLSCEIELVESSLAELVH